MNKNNLKKKLEFSKLIIGDVNKKVNDFLKNYKHAPKDQYSMTLIIITQQLIHLKYLIHQF